MSGAEPIGFEVLRPAGEPAVAPCGVDVPGLLERSARERETIVVVRVQDGGHGGQGGRGGHGGEAVVRCLDAILRHTRDARVVVIDDGSTDVRVIGDLERREKLGEIERVRHDEARGPERTHADALALSDTADIALVDGDVEVGPGWLGGLRRVALGAPSVASVTALLATGEDWPAHQSWADIARAAAQSALPWSLEIPAGAGAATLITRTAGPGGVHLLAPRVLVRRIGDARAHGPAATTDPRLREQMETIRQRVRTEGSIPARRLYVTFRAGGPPSAGLAGQLVAYQDSYVLESVDARGLELSRCTRSGKEALVAWHAAEPFVATDPWRADYATAVTTIALNLGIETVHVEHLIDHPPTTLPDLARRLDLPLLLTADDLLLPERPSEPPDGGRSSRRNLRAGEWWRGVEAVAAAGGTVVVPSAAGADALGPALAAATLGRRPAIRVIEPGTEVGKLAALRQGTSRLPGPVRILTMAPWHEPAAVDYLRALANRLGPRVEWHVLGQNSDALADVAVAHGPYRPETLRRVAVEIDPDLAVSVTGREAYSVALSQAWALGLPTLVTEPGAGADRVLRHGGGRLLPAADPEGAADLIAELIADRGALAALRREVPRGTVVPFVATAEAYHALHEEPAGRAAAPHRLGYAISGWLGRHGGCQHIRLLRPLRNAPVERRVAARHVFIAELLAGPVLDDLDTLLVQRDSLGPATEEVIAAVRARGIRLVVEIDDDLLDEHAAPRMSIDADAHRALRIRFSALIRSADQVLVSTETLRRRLAGLTTRDPLLVPNDLDPRLWLPDLEPQKAPKGRELRVLYMGSTTHLEDLMLLEPVIARVAAALGRPVVLEVVGVAGPFDGDDWITRLDIPQDQANYPEFVSWLRSRRLRWAAAVAPLADTVFNQAKSDLKLLEYAMLGLPVVASDVGPYRGAAELARLTSNDPDAWVQALTAVLADPATSAAQAEGAMAHVRAHRLLGPDRVGAWLSAITG